MVSPAGRRKVRKRRAQAENSRMKLTAITGIMLLAVFLGFLTARFVIGPIIGYNADESEIRLAEEQNEPEAAENDSMDINDNDGQEQSVSTVPTEGYALQFGVFSTEGAAEELSKQLASKGIDTEIVEVGDVFKVISPVTEDREAAISALEDAKSKEVTDVFIASFQ